MGNSGEIKLNEQTDPSVWSIFLGKSILWSIFCLEYATGVVVSTRIDSFFSFSVLW